MTTLRGNLFDRIEVWGQPWHGRMDATGVLDLGGGKTKTSTIIPTGGQAQLVQFDGLPEPVDKPCDTAVGASWKNWAILAGNRRQYMPLQEYFFDPNSWLYRTADGTVWALRVSCESMADPVEIKALNVHKVTGDVWQTIYTGLTAYKSAIVSMTNANRTALSASKKGDKALLHLEQSYSFSASMSSNSDWIGTYAIKDVPVSATYAEITVSGGSATIPPSVAVAMMTSDDVLTREAYPTFSNATVHDRAKWLVSAWMRPDGVVSKVYLDIDVTRTLAGYVDPDGPGSWSALLSAAVAAKLVFPDRETQILALTTTAVVSPSGGTTSVSTTSTPPGTTTATAPSFSITHRSSLDCSVQMVAVNANYRAIGCLGQQANPITLGEFSTGVWCQHPMTGELTVGGHFF